MGRRHAWRPMSIQIKICGITRDQDADAVVDAGAEALGLNFCAASARRIEPGRAAALAQRVAGAVTRVGVFLDSAASDVERVLTQVDLDVLQFHGDEPGAFCRQFGKPYIKALRVRAPLDMAAIEADYGDACCLLLDAFVAGQAGGTGMTFDWRLWPQTSAVPLVLAGGLTPDNVADAIRRLGPWGVDVAGGVEGARKGEKDSARIARFVAEVRQCEERTDTISR